MKIVKSKEEFLRNSKNKQRFINQLTERLANSRYKVLHAQDEADVLAVFRKNPANNDLRTIPPPPPRSVKVKINTEVGFGFVKFDLVENNHLNPKIHPNRKSDSPIFSPFKWRFGKLCKGNLRGFCD